MTSPILFRCSSLGNITTPPKKGEIGLSKTCTSYLKQVYRELKYSRVREYSNKYLRKGIEMEEDAITLLSRVRKTLLTKNTERLNNDFITGEPDAFIGKEIRKAEIGFDTKCSYDIWTFPFKEDKPDAGYEWQAQGYMALTGAEKWVIAYCLTNTPAKILNDEKMKIYYAMGCPDDENEEYIGKVIELEKNHIFCMKDFKERFPYYDLECRVWDYDIPIDERVVQFEIERDEDKINSIYERVKECREYLRELFDGKEIEEKNAA